MSKLRKRSLKVIEPWKIHVNYTFGGFNLTFEASRNNEIRRAEIVLHFCDVEELARQLWGVLNDQQTKINSTKAVLKGEAP